MEHVAWHMKRGNWWIKSGIVGVLCVLFFLSITAFGSVIPTMILLLAIGIYTWVLKTYEHYASIEVEILKNLADQYKRDKSYTQEDLETIISSILQKKFGALEETGNINDIALRDKYRTLAKEKMAKRIKESEEAYFRQIAKLEAMGYTKDEIYEFHHLTYQHAGTEYGSKLNVFMFRTQDSKAERMVKCIVGMIFLTFWGLELYTFISDNSPFIRFVKLLLMGIVFGFVWSGFLGLSGYKVGEKTHSTCGTCGNLYTGPFCGCYWAAYINWKK